MSGIVRQVLIPASRRAHQGVLSMFIPRNTYATEKAAVPMSDEEELKIKKIFTAYDKNHDGWISRGEWYDVVNKFLNDKDAAWILAEKIMDDLDVDPKDEKVTYSEFRAGMKSQWHLFRPRLNNVNK